MDLHFVDGAIALLQRAGLHNHRAFPVGILYVLITRYAPESFTLLPRRCPGLACFYLHPSGKGHSVDLHVDIAQNVGFVCDDIMVSRGNAKKLVSLRAL